jgi:hypothetical protein
VEDVRVHHVHTEPEGVDEALNVGDEEAVRQVEVARLDHLV